MYGRVYDKTHQESSRAVEQWTLCGHVHDKFNSDIVPGVVEVVEVIVQTHPHMSPNRAESV